MEFGQKTALYFREDGVVCYVGWFLCVDSTVDSVSRKLLDSGLEIWWSSVRCHPLPAGFNEGFPIPVAPPQLMPGMRIPAIGYPIKPGWAWSFRPLDPIPTYPTPPGHLLLRLPQVREFTRLTEQNGGDLQDDYRERDTNDYARSVTLLMGNGGVAEIVADANRLKKALLDFEALRESPLRAVSFDTGDSAQYIYTAPRPDERVRIILSGLGVKVSTPHHTKPYRKLNRARLEFWVDSILKAIPQPAGTRP
jgi:hypothetical protein